MKPHILSTKKLDDPVRQQVMAEGFELTEKEMIRVEESVSPLMIERIGQLTAEDIVVFTSQHAVSAVQTRRPGLPCKVYCISGRTRQAAVTGLPAAGIIGIAGTASGLAEAIIAAGVKSLVFFCGNERREELPAILSSHGIRLEELEVYQTIDTPSRIEEKFDAVLFFSPSAVRSFFSLNELPAHVVCFSIGTTTAAAIRQYGNIQPIIAAEPSQEAMLAAVRQYFNNR